LILWEKLSRKIINMIKHKPRAKGVACQWHYTADRGKLFNHPTSPSTKSFWYGASSEAFFARGKFLKNKRRKKLHGLFSAEKHQASESAAEREYILFKKCKNCSVTSLFIFCNIVLIPIIEIFCLPVKKKSRKFLWRKAAIFNIGWYFYLSGLKIKVEGMKKISNKKPMIYIANHLSGIDGFILIYLLGPDITPLMAPVKYFPFPYSYWFGKMEYIDVQRSDIEKEKYRTSYEPHQAIKKAIKELKSGHSILIFPEGHISPQHKLLYFHTGAARIALAADKKITPIGIIGTDKITLSKFTFLPGTIKVIFGEPIDLVEYYKNNKSTIKKTSEKLKKEVRSLLLKKYYSLGYDEKSPEKTAVLFNIDNTLYDGNAQKDFIYYSWKRGSIEIKYLLAVFYYYMLSKCKIISYFDSFNYSILILKGWRADKLYRLNKLIFNKNLKYNVYEKMRAIIKDHKEKGHKIILITHMVAPLAKCFADYVGADYWVSLYLEEKKLKYTGKLIKKYMNNEKSKQVLELKKILKFELGQSFAYGHDYDDLPMLKLVKYKTLVNPEKDLKKYGKKHNCEILEI